MRRGCWAAGGAAVVIVLCGVAPALAGAAPGRPVAILCDDLPVVGGASRPEVLAETLRGAGYEVALLDAAALADPAHLNTANFAVLILPYGATFPADAVDNLRAFLRQGGSFLATGGYAFDCPVVKRGGQWVRVGETEAGGPELVADGGFATAGAWSCTDTANCTLDSQDPYRGRRSACVSLGGVGEGSAEWHQELREPPRGELVEGRVAVSSEGVAGPGYGYFALYQWDESGDLVAWADLVHTWDDTDWREYRFKVRIKPEAARVEVKCGIYHAVGRVWFDEVSLRLVRPVRINTHFGEPGDGLGVEPEQIGVFDADYRLSNVTRAVAAEGQHLLSKDFAIEAPLEGWGASAVLGWGERRRVPLLVGLDKYGRPRGSVGSLIYNLAGPYAGSAWAILGASNRDLFAPGESSLLRWLPGMVAQLQRKVFLHGLTPEFACYGAGEILRYSVRLANQGPWPFEGQVRFEVSAPGWAGESGAEPVSLQPGEQREVKGECRAPEGMPLCKLRATLCDSEGALDECESGFVVRGPQEGESAAKVRMVRNYLRVGGVPSLISGTDFFGSVFDNAMEHARVWDNEMAAMRSLGLGLYENLGVNPTSYGEPYVLPERLWRTYEALTLLAARHGLVFFPGLFIAFDAAADEEELRRQEAYAAEFARRLSGLGNVIYYLNGDVRLEPTSAAASSLWPAFLRERYGDEASWRAAWGPRAEGESWPEPRLPTKATGWHDVAYADFCRFQVWLMRRWEGRLADAVSAADPHAMTGLEFYQRPYGGVDVRLGAGGRSMANIGFFDLPGRDLVTLPLALGFASGQRTGRGLSVGEFGAKTHPAWQYGSAYHIARTPEQQADLFLAVTHYAFGMGGAKVHNWCWKDNQEFVFPWGLLYPGDGVPKPVAKAYRAASLFFRAIRPEYRPGTTVVIVPDTHRLGAGAEAVTQAVWRSERALLELHVPFEVINEADAATLDASTVAAVFPVPYTISDETFEHLSRWIAQGGRLYLSGDISYDGQRRRTRGRRLEDLCGVMAEAQPGSVEGQVPQGPRVVEAKEGTRLEGRAYVRRVGQGLVWFLPEPPELLPEYDAGKLRDQYRRFVAAGVRPLEVEPDSVEVHVFRLLGGKREAHIVLNTGDAKTVAFGPEGALEAMVAAKKPAGAVLEGKGVVAAEADGLVRVHGEPLCEASAHYFVVALDGRDVRSSRALLAVLLGPGRLCLWSRTHWREPVAELGEFEAERWRPLMDRPCGSDQGLRLEVGLEEIGDLFLVCERGELEHWRGRVEDVVLRPQRLPW